MTVLYARARTPTSHRQANPRAITACSPHILSNPSSRRSLYPKRVPSWLLRQSESDLTALTPRTTTAADDRRRIARRTWDSRITSSKPTVRAVEVESADDRAGTMGAVIQVYRKAPTSHMHRRLLCHHLTTMLSHQQGRLNRHHPLPPPPPPLPLPRHHLCLCMRLYKP